MVRQLRRLALGLLLGAVVGWLWLRRQQSAETAGEQAAPPTPGSGGLSSQSDERIVLPTWTGSPPRREEDNPVPGRIVLPEGVENAAPPANGEASVDERLVMGGNGVEPTAALSASGAATTEETAPTGNGDITPLAASEDATADATEGTGSSVEGYCVRCKEQRPMVNVHPYTTANKRPALKGECAVCGAGMFKFIKE